MLSTFLRWIETLEHPFACGWSSVPGQRRTWHALRTLGALEPGAPNRQMVCPVCEFSQLIVCLRQDRRYEANCPVCGIVPVEADRVEQAMPSRAWLLESLAQALGLPADRPRERVAPSMTRLGYAQYGGESFAIYGARCRGRSEEDAQVAAALRMPAHGKQIVLTTRPGLLWLNEPGVRYVIAMEDVATLDDDGLHVDRDRLFASAGKPPSPPAVAVDVGADGSWIRIGEEELCLQGRQRRVAILLFEAHKKGLRPRREEVMCQAGYAPDTELRHLSKRARFFQFFGHGHGRIWINA